MEHVALPWHVLAQAPFSQLSLQMDWRLQL